MRGKHSCGNPEAREEIKVTFVIPDMISDTLPDKRGGEGLPPTEPLWAQPKSIVIQNNQKETSTLLCYISLFFG